jgi:hypothetical protein
VRERKIIDSDVFVFVSYIPDSERESFSEDYVVIPRTELAKLCERKKASKGTFSFYFTHEGIKVWESRKNRHDPIDVSRFRRAWHLI